MKRAILIGIVMIATLSTACSPKPAAPNRDFPVMQPSGATVRHWTTLETVTRYRASLTSLVFGAVDLCLDVYVSEDFGPDEQPVRDFPRCRTMFVVPGVHYDVDYRIDDPLAPRTALAILTTLTSNVAFIGELLVLEGAPLGPCGAYCGSDF